MVRDRFRNALVRAARRARSERGFAVPTTLLMTVAAMGVVSVGVLSSIQTQRGSVRDQGTKTALSVAEAGVSEALLHFNRIPPSDLNACSPVSAFPPSGGWCPPVSGNVENATYTYQVRPLTQFSGSTVTGRTIEVVSTGSLNGVNRRVYVKGSSSSGTAIFFDSTVIAKDTIHLDSNASVEANMATNGDVIMDANATLCGHAKFGIGKTFTTTSNAIQTCGTRSQGNLQLPPVNQGDAPTNNDNGRLFSHDLVSGNKQWACWNGFKANGQPGTCGSRHLALTNNGAVTLGGSKYSFCKLTTDSNSALYIQAESTVTIYFDSPENCGLSPGENQMELLANSRITSTDGGPANVALLFVGSRNIQTNILLNSNTSIGLTCHQNFVVYAPFTDIRLNSNSAFCGAIGGKSVEIDANSSVITSADSNTYQLPNTPPHYEVGDFIECSAAPASPPNAGC